jgi:hypothetical protein
MAQEHGDRYRLSVVERTDGPGTKGTRMQNPAARITQFQSGHR